MKNGEVIAELDGIVVNANLKIVEDKIKIINNKLLSLRLEKESYINNKLPEFEKYNISSISKDIVAQKFENFIYKNKNFNSEKINLSSEIELKNLDKTQNPATMKGGMENVKRKQFQLLIYNRKRSLLFKI